jgi:hypothetical protein
VDDPAKRGRIRVGVVYAGGEVVETNKKRLRPTTERHRRTKAEQSESRKEAGPGIELNTHTRVDSLSACLSVVELKGGAVLVIVQVRVVGVPVGRLHGQGVGVVAEALSRILGDRRLLVGGGRSIVDLRMGVALEGGNHLRIRVLNNSIVRSGLRDDDVVTVTVHGVLEGHFCLGRSWRIGLARSNDRGVVLIRGAVVGIQTALLRWL